jgi:hypothetical protein
MNISNAVLKQTVLTTINAVGASIFPAGYIRRRKTLGLLAKLTDYRKGGGMSQDGDEAKRMIWAQGAAESIIDDVLAARYTADDQAALLRELARQGCCI